MSHCSTRWMASAVFVLLTTGALGRASATPATAGRLEISGGARYGLSLGSDAAPSPFGFGLGLHLGYTLQQAIYLGASFDYFFGESRDVAGVDLGHSVWLAAGEAGYDIQLIDALLVRPKVGVGLAMLRERVCAGTCESSDQARFTVAPGITALILLGITLSLDVRYQMVLGEPTMLNALIFSLGFGF